MKKRYHIAMDVMRHSYVVELRMVTKILLENIEYTHDYSFNTPHVYNHVGTSRYPLSIYMAYTDEPAAVDSSLPSKPCSR